VRLGWSHGDQEIFSLADMLRLFRVEDVNHSASRFDRDKLDWLNQHYLKTDDPAATAVHLEWQLREQGMDPARGPKPAEVVVALAERCKTLKEMAERARVWYAPLSEYDATAVDKHLVEAAAAPLADVRERIARQAEWSPAAVQQSLADTVAALGIGMGKLAQPLRVAITGTAVSPSIEHTVYLAGRDEALRRIDAALGRIAQRVA
jgi:glutamyl-tRNA synthetase